MGVVRNFKVGLQINGIKSQPADVKLSLKGAWSGSRDTSPPEISLQRLQLETSNFVYYLAAWSISLVMLDYPKSGRGQGHVTHFYILGRPYLWSG